MHAAWALPFKGRLCGQIGTLRSNITNCALYLAVVFPECCVQNCEPEGAIGWTGRSYFSIWTLVLSSFCLRKVPEPRKATNKLAVGAKDTRSGIFVEMVPHKLSFPVTRRLQHVMLENLSNHWAPWGRKGRPSPTREAVERTALSSVGAKHLHAIHTRTRLQHTDPS